MADISAIQKLRTSITVKLINLDGSWTNGVRYIYWYYKIHDGTPYNEITGWNMSTENATTVQVGDKESSNYTYSGLLPNTKYDLLAKVVAVNTGEIWNFYASATTGGSTIIEDFTVTTTQGSLNVNYYIEIITDNGFIWELQVQEPNGWWAIQYGIIDYYETDDGLYIYRNTIKGYDWHFGEEWKLKLVVFTRDGASVVAEEIRTVYFADIPPRPDNWYWNTAIKSGETRAFDGKEIHPVTAAEWNNFIVRVNEFRDYCGLSFYGFSTVSPGQDVKLAYNKAVEAIRAMGYSTSTDLPDIGSDTVLSPILFTRLETALSKIP